MRTPNFSLAQILAVDGQLLFILGWLFSWSFLFFFALVTFSLKCGKAKDQLTSAGDAWLGPSCPARAPSLLTRCVTMSLASPDGPVSLLTKTRLLRQSIIRPDRPNTSDLSRSIRLDVAILLWQSKRRSVHACDNGRKRTPGLRNSLSMMESPAQASRTHSLGPTARSSWV